MLNIFDINVVFSNIEKIIKYVPVTLEIAVAAELIGILVGLFIAVIKIKRVPVLKQITSIYISFFRGTPIIVQLYISYYGIPIALQYVNFYWNKDIQMASISPLFFAILTLALNSSAFNSVVIQSAFDGVNKGEIEAAEAIGMTGIQRLFRIIIPEALDLAIPNLGNQFIGLIKGTSLAFSCAVIEMTAEAKILGSKNYRYFEAYVALAVLYWLITIGVEIIIKIIINLVHVPDVIDGTEKSFVRKVAGVVSGKIRKGNGKESMKYDKDKQYKEKFCFKSSFKRYMLRD